MICRSQYDEQKYVGPGSVVQCDIITSTPALLSDFPKPPYRLKETDQVNLQPFQGTNHGTFFQFTFIAPIDSKEYTVQCLAFQASRNGHHVLAESEIFVGM